MGGGVEAEILIGGEVPTDLFLCGEKVIFVEGDLETPVQSPVRDDDGREPFILSDISNLENISSGGEPHPCDECGLEFLSELDLDNHKKMEQSVINDEVGDLKCDVCGNFFNSTNTLEEHKKSMHGAKEFSCNVCNKHFTRSNHLKIHKRTHTGERPYPCDDCNKRFIDNTSLKQHMKIHSGIGIFVFRFPFI